jgi:hypothetical protein
MTNVIALRFTSKWPWNITSPVIAWLGGSKEFSHVMAIVDGKAYEATMLHGCRVVPLAVAMDGVAAYQDMLVPVADVSAAVAWGEMQDGKRYDFAGALGLPLLMSDDWADDDKWWCSELVFMQLVKGGTVLLDPDITKRVTPEHLRMCNYQKSKVIKLKEGIPMEHLKNTADTLSVAAAVSAFLGWLPSLAALASLIWTCIRIYEWFKNKRSGAPSPKVSE